MFENGCLDRWVLRLRWVLKPRQISCTQQCTIEEGKKPGRSDIIHNNTSCIDMPSRLKKRFQQVYEGSCIQTSDKADLEILGKSNRYPLPCYIYTRVRTEFQSKSCHGFEDEDSHDEGEVTDSEQSSGKGT